jgi:hypothetical protein
MRAQSGTLTYQLTGKSVLFVVFYKDGTGFIILFIFALFVF